MSGSLSAENGLRSMPNKGIGRDGHDRSFPKIGHQSTKTSVLFCLVEIEWTPLSVARVNAAAVCSEEY